MTRPFIDHLVGSRRVLGSTVQLVIIIGLRTRARVLSERSQGEEGIVGTLACHSGLSREDAPM